MRTFSRGPGPLVSILFPTRGRPEGLCKAVDSLWSLARDKSLIEFIFKADTDDQTAIDTICRINTLGEMQSKTIISPRGNGYHDMHHWVNEMAGLAKGDWLIIWNDDALMTTQDWDQVLLQAGADFVGHGVTDICCLSINTINHPGAKGFFFLRRKVVEILGRFSYIPHNDTWVTTLMQAVDSLYPTESIAVAHVDGVRDAVHVEGDAARGATTYTIHNPEGRRVKMEDALKLARYIEEKSRESAL